MSILNNKSVGIYNTIDKIVFTSNIIIFVELFRPIHYQSICIGTRDKLAKEKKANPQLYSWEQ